MTCIAHKFPQKYYTFFFFLTVYILQIYILNFGVFFVSLTPLFKG